MRRAAAPWGDGGPSGEAPSLRRRLAAAALLLAAAASAFAADPRAELPGAIGAVGLDGARGLVHVVVVARWCAPCESEIQALRRSAPAVPRGSYQVVYVGVSRRQTAAEFNDWMRGLGVDGTRVYDADGSLETRLGAATLPYHVVIGPGRRVLARGDRAPSAAQLQRWAAEAASAAPDQGSRSR